jgi:hypothetical protein
VNYDDLLKDMQTKYLIIIILIPAFSFAVSSNCDSTLFKKLIDFSNQTKITESEFLACKDIVDSLDNYDCDYMVKNERLVTSLTFLFGKICYKTNTDTAIRSFVNYQIHHIGSAEEQISFSFENLFSLQPKLILDEILKTSDVMQKDLLNSLAWGFLNNRNYGIDDPLADDPFKAMTVYDNPPDPILNRNNYKEIFYQAHPETKNLYPYYRVQYDYIFSKIVEYFDWRDKMWNERKD